MVDGGNAERRRGGHTKEEKDRGGMIFASSILHQQFVIKQIVSDTDNGPQGFNCKVLAVGDKVVSGVQREKML